VWWYNRDRHSSLSRVLSHSLGQHSPLTDQISQCRFVQPILWRSRKPNPCRLNFCQAEWQSECFGTYCSGWRPCFGISFSGLLYSSHSKCHRQQNFHARWKPTPGCQKERLRSCSATLSLAIPPWNRHRHPCQPCAGLQSTPSSSSAKHSQQSPTNP
jgi:hypothetical protein